MSQDGPAVDLARGDRVAGYRVTSVLGHGREGVAATVTDEFLDLERVLKAYPAEPHWVERLRYVAQAFFELAELGVCPISLHGGVTASSRSIPMACLVFERRLGKPLDQMLSGRRWTVWRARRLVADLAETLTRVHATGWLLNLIIGGQGERVGQPQRSLWIAPLDGGAAGRPRRAARVSGRVDGGSYLGGGALRALARSGPKAPRASGRAPASPRPRPGQPPR